MARRFLVEEHDIEKINENVIKITGKEVKHIQVLRHNVGEEITVNHGIYKIEKMKRDSITLRYVTSACEIGVPNYNITLYIAMLKNDKMDFVVQKATELGVKIIVPFFSSNVVVKLDEDGRLKRKAKLQKIANEACKQCGRTDSVEVADFIDLSNLQNNLNEHEVILFAYEASKTSLKSEIGNIKTKGYKDIGVIIGAEGGFTPKEAEDLNSNERIKTVGLGQRILRAETAVVSLLAILDYELEEK